MKTDIGVPGITGAVEIGRGAFGRVYKADQEEFNRVVAVKVLANVDLDDEARMRFAREARAVGRMSGHPNIVDVYAQGSTDDGKPYLIMEFCSGGTLGEHNRISWQEATEAIVAVAGALQTAHDIGILHRDIKPANILLDSYGTPKLGDFGIARMESEAHVTATGMLTGSPAHMAPELIAGQPPSPASDIYALASTLFTAMSGRAPFHRETDTTILSLLQRITSEPAPYLGAQGVPPPIADLVAAGLAKDPAQRPPSCRDFAQALMSARVRLGLPPGDYRVDKQSATASSSVDATVLPGRMSPGPVPGPLSHQPGPPVPVGHHSQQSIPHQPGPHQPSPHHVQTGPHHSQHLAHQQPHQLNHAVHSSAEAVASGTPSRTALIILCWVVVALSLLITVWMLVDRAGSSAAAYLIGG